MNIIKLSAINSTNDYLKKLSAGMYVENFTIVTAENQTGGKGQMGAEWNVEAGKNLTFSLLIKDLLLNINEIFDLNAATAVSILEALTSFNIPDLGIKWPNDILAGNKKVGGILIENSIRTDGEIYSIIGIGLNVNQVMFDGLPKAASLATVTGRQFDKEAILLAVAEKIKWNVSGLLNRDTTAIWEKYHQKLYKKEIPMTFEKDNRKFMGIIKGVTKNGSLKVLLDDDTVAEFRIKEVQLLY
ncbi:MAG: biotin--[acetyl-CoA-carboxylase] ligase [Flavobacterium sp.]|nr:MAG: biotin--[acetyl-CoA-carboxylase] ligase [Flavobacterium sp.]